MADFKTPVKPPRSALIAETPFIIPPSPFLKQLGYGTGVSVYEMVRSPKVGKIRSPWAIKRVSEKKNIKTIFGKRLLEEAGLLKQMDHPNVVGFRKFSQMKDGRPCLAMESCGGSLGDRIESRREDELGSYPSHNIMKVALDISKALDYIHTKIKLLHGDIKSFNVLVNGDFEICKLCDFGVSLPLDENGALDEESTECYVGTECWSAPEVVNETGLITCKADIFSFGLTLWEMIALEPPHVDHSCDNLDDSVIIVEDDSIIENTLYGTRPAVPDVNKIEYRDVLALFYCATEADYRCRPTAYHITICIENMLSKKVKK